MGQGLSAHAQRVAHPGETSLLSLRASSLSTGSGAPFNAEYPSHKIGKPFIFSAVPHNKEKGWREELNGHAERVNSLRGNGETAMRYGRAVYASSDFLLHII